MKPGRLTLAFAYLRLSREEAQRGESSSITNQRLVISNYCKQNNIVLVREFVDDGWSGGNFDRPDFREMISELEKGKANTVITKDLSRLGRDMREASYYAEQFFPERGIRYIAIGDNFDTEHDNIMAPFQFAMNEVYLRDGSRKVKEVLRHKRANGQYCACPPYGYRKDTRDRNRLVPDEQTAPIVKRIFRCAAQGDSSRKIALDLNADGIIPPLKYRVLYRDQFSDEGAARAADTWNYTTVKRILKNAVYLGHTVLGKSKKLSVKSDKKVPIPKEDWTITPNTHEALVSQKIFDLAQANMGRGTKLYQGYEPVRKSIFSGVAFCAECGHALCSCGTVYKGERIKYWYLSCTHQRQDIPEPCVGVRIRYTDLIELVREDLNSFLRMSDEEIKVMVDDIVTHYRSDEVSRAKKLQREKAEARLTTIDRIIAKLYLDNAEGTLDDLRLRSMVAELERESKSLNEKLLELRVDDPGDIVEKNYEQFFRMARKYTALTELDRETLLTFVDRIEIGPKIYPDGVKPSARGVLPFQQKVRIFYKFVGEVNVSPVSTFDNIVNS